MLINVINVNPIIPIQGMGGNSLQKSSQGRSERLTSVINQSKQYGLSIRFWEGATSEPLRCSSISKSHKQIVRDAKERGLDMCCIAEDDFVISAPGAWEHYLENIPKEFDIFSGGIYSGQVVDNRIMNGFSGLTLYTVHNRFYDFFLNLNPIDHIDRAMGNFCFEKLYLICNPYIVYQLEGYSDNHGRDTAHSSYLEKMKLFGRD